MHVRRQAALHAQQLCAHESSRMETSYEFDAKDGNSADLVVVLRGSPANL